MSLRRLDSVRVGEALPALSKVVTREDIAAYAEASHDRNPLHIDDAHARRRGFDGIIAHGMLTMAHLTTCITGWLGDPSGLVHTKVSFRAAVRPGDEMVAGGEVVSIDSDARTATLDVWVTIERDGRVEYPVKRSHAQVRLAAPQAARG